MCLPPFSGFICKLTMVLVMRVRYSDHYLLRRVSQNSSPSKGSISLIGRISHLIYITRLNSVVVEGNRLLSSFRRQIVFMTELGMFVIGIDGYFGRKLSKTNRFTTADVFIGKKDAWIKRLVNPNIAWTIRCESEDKIIFIWKPSVA